MAQRTRPLNQHEQLITAQSSLQQVKILVDAGIGCIAFLRGLFDEDSFEDARLEAPRPNDATTAVRSGRDKDRSEKPSSVRIKRLKRGGCESADKLVDWLELGVSDGIDKGYLHRLAFAIYLDPDDPTNLVESYTFSFTYETDDRGNRRAAMTMRDQMQEMILTSKGTEEVHKEGEVRRQVQQVIKNLLTSTQLLDELPRRRFFTLRAFWDEATPDDYQPPGFKKITRGWPDFSLATTSINDVPETVSLGTMQTGYHDVSIHTVTIAHVLETSFDDTITKPEATERNQREAATRSVLWNAQTLVESVLDEDDAMKVPQPVAVRDDRGHVVEIETVVHGEGFDELRKKVGIVADPDKGVIARGLFDRQLVVDSNLSDNENLRRAIVASSGVDPNCNDPVTQEDPVVNRMHSYKSATREVSDLTAEENQRALALNGVSSSMEVDGNSDPNDTLANDVAAKCTATQKGKGSARLHDAAVGPQIVESQLLEFSHPAARTDSRDTIMNDSSKDAIETFPEPDTIRTDTEPDRVGSASAMGTEPSRAGHRGPYPTRSRQTSRDEVCECGDGRELGVMVCCSTCESWRHNACYGYPEDNDAVPDVFTCYRCQAHAAVGRSEHSKGDVGGDGDDGVRGSDIEHALAELKSLALFRRAIALVGLDGVVDSNYLAENLRVDKTTAAQVLKRLRSERFIVENPVPKRTRSKGIKHVAKRSEYIVNTASKHVKFRDSTYFSPGLGAERPILALLTASESEPRSAHGGDVGTDEASHLAHRNRGDRASDLSSTTTPRVLVPATPSPVTPLGARSPSVLASSRSTRALALVGAGRRSSGRDQTLQAVKEVDDEVRGGGGGGGGSDASSSELSDLDDDEDDDDSDRRGDAERSTRMQQSDMSPKSRLGHAVDKDELARTVESVTPAREGGNFDDESRRELLPVSPVLVRRDVGSHADASSPSSSSREQDRMRVDDDDDGAVTRGGHGLASTTTTDMGFLSTMKRRVPPAREEGQDDDDEVRRGSTGDGTPRRATGRPESEQQTRPKKKQKVSESEENLEAE